VPGFCPTNGFVSILTGLIIASGVAIGKNNKIKKEM
jgi:hypothetical protein